MINQLNTVSGQIFTDDEYNYHVDDVCTMGVNCKIINPQTKNVVGDISFTYNELSKMRKL